MIISPPALMRLLFTAVAVMLLWTMPTIFHGYYARYHTMAARVAPTSTEYTKALNRALIHYPQFNYANQLMAQYALRENRLGAALEYQRAAMESFVSVTSIERMGTILSKLNRRDAARDQLEKAARIHPGSVGALEQLAFFAYDEGDSVRLQSLTAEILRYDLENINAWYLRALDAWKTGNLESALTYLERVSAALSKEGESTRRFAGTRFEVDRRLTELKQAIESK